MFTSFLLISLPMQWSILDRLLRVPFVRNSQLVEPCLQSETLVRTEPEKPALLLLIDSLLFSRSNIAFAALSIILQQQCVVVCANQIDKVSRRELQAPLLTRLLRIQGFLVSSSLFSGGACVLASSAWEFSICKSCVAVLLLQSVVRLPFCPSDVQLPVNPRVSE